MSWCDKLHLEDATIYDLLQELETAHSCKQLTDDHITVLKEIIEEYEK